MILCCGEALIDMLPASTQGGTPAFAAHPGGAVMNTAVALGRLGCRAGMLTGLSRDLFGRQLEAAMVASGVDTSLCARSDRPTTLAFVELRGGQASYTFYDENTALSALTPEQLPSLPDEVGTLFFGGISLCGLSVGTTFARLCAQGAAGRVVMLDPNIRPGFVTDEAAYRARLAEMIAVSDIVKVSCEDLDWLYPDGRSLGEKQRALLEAGPLVVLLTRGARGAHAIARNGTQAEVAAREVEVLDTVGAGDTFNAGVLAAFERMGVLTKSGLGNLSETMLGAALSYGTRAAAITVGRVGADPPWARELA